MTVSPGERHNILAIRLSRDRRQDPFMNVPWAEAKWARKDAPSLEPHPDDEFHVDIPGYDLRRLLLAEDPLAAVNAFMLQIRTILATALGVRMCPHCPHCSSTSYPCQDALGSVAELMGGLAGRADALFGGVECQKSNGSLHYHLFVFVQRLHKFLTMRGIAELLEKKLVEASELKQFLSNICCGRYADVEQHVSSLPMLEKHFPTYSEDTECGEHQVWGDIKLGRLPGFLYEDARQVQAVEPHTYLAPSAEQSVDATPYKQRFESAFQYFQSRCQRRIHKMENGKRVVSNACRSKAKPTQCKHEAPWTNRVSPSWMTGPLLVCKALRKDSNFGAAAFVIGSARHFSFATMSG